jgi:hypothetical protein
VVNRVQVSLLPHAGLAGSQVCVQMFARQNPPLTQSKVRVHAAPIGLGAGQSGSRVAHDSRQ